LLLFASALATYGVTLKVSARHEAVRSIKAQIKADTRAIRILQMELTYLASPQRVQALSDQFLSVQAPRAEQFVASVGALKPFLVPNVENEAPKMLVVRSELGHAQALARSQAQDDVPATVEQAEAAAASVRAAQGQLVQGQLAQNQVQTAQIKVVQAREVPARAKSDTILPKEQKTEKTPRPAKAEGKPTKPVLPASSRFLSAEALSSIETAAAREEAQDRSSGDRRSGGLP
jgi:hypothetical protein